MNHHMPLEINTNSAFSNINQPKLITPINISDPNNMLNSENYLNVNSSQINGFSTQYSVPLVAPSNQTNNQDMMIISQTNHVQPVSNVTSSSNMNIINLPTITHITLADDENEALDSSDDEENLQTETTKDTSKEQEETFTREDKKYMCKLCPYATDHNTNMKKHVKGHEPKEGLNHFFLFTILIVTTFSKFECLF